MSADRLVHFFSRLLWRRSRATRRALACCFRRIRLSWALRNKERRKCPSTRVFLFCTKNGQGFHVTVLFHDWNGNTLDCEPVHKRTVFNQHVCETLICFTYPKMSSTNPIHICGRNPAPGGVSCLSKDFELTGQTVGYTQAIHNKSRKNPRNNETWMWSGHATPVGCEREEIGYGQKRVDVCHDVFWHPGPLGLYTCFLSLADSTRPMVCRLHFFSL